jgi:hypothetical protein
VPASTAPASVTSSTRLEQQRTESVDLEKISEDPIAEDSRTGTVQYHNRDTGTDAEYDLDVEYDGSGDVDRIIFPSGGYISEHHITDQTHNGDGTITVTTDRGQEFTVDEEEGHESEEE